MKEVESTEGLLKELSNEIYKTILQNLESKNIRPVEDVFTQWIYPDSYYSESGVIVEGVHSNEFVKPSWDRANRGVIDEVKSLEIFKRLDGCLQEKFKKNPLISIATINFVSFFIHRLLEDIQSFEGIKDEIIRHFLLELDGEPMKSYSTVFIQGVIINSPPIRLNENLVLRRISKEELEKPVKALSHFEKPISPFDNISACFDIEIPLSIDPWVTLQSEVEKNTSILRLFCTASIYRPIYTLNTNSILNFIPGGPMRSLHVHHSFVSHIILEADTNNLIEFYNSIKLPSVLYDSGRKASTPIKVAFERYKESLLDNETMERRIATVVMGIEAIMSEGGSELIYKISTRGSKLFGIIYGNPSRYKELLRDAYEIRSSFAHGDILTKKQINRLQRKYGEDLKNIFLEVANFLRISIIIFLKLGKDKRAFISLIDNALIDLEEHKKLEDEILPILKLVRPTEAQNKYVN